MELLTKCLYVLISLALIYAGVSDLKTRVVPRVAGWGILGIGLLFLLLNQLWIEALFYVAAVLLSNASFGGKVALVVSAVVVYGIGSRDIPFLAGTVYILLIFWLGWFGGGDAQIGMGLVAMSRDWWMLLYIFGIYLLVGMVLMVILRGPKNAFSRLTWVAQHLSFAENDHLVIKVPWGAIAAIGGIFYLLVYPGLFWR